MTPSRMLIWRRREIHCRALQPLVCDTISKQKNLFFSFFFFVISSVKDENELCSSRILMIKIRRISSHFVSETLKFVIESRRTIDCIVTFWELVSPYVKTINVNNRECIDVFFASLFFPQNDEKTSSSATISASVNRG